MGSVDVDKFKRGADTGLTKLADRLNGLNDYYNYNGEANEIVNIQEEELELESTPSHQESKQSNNADAKVSEKPNEPEEKNSETLTYKNDKSSEDEKFKKFEKFVAYNAIKTYKTIKIADDSILAVNITLIISIGYNTLKTI